MNRSPHSGRSWIPWLFVAFFGVVLVANGIMVWVGYVSWTGLVTDRAYEQGLRYEQVLQQAERQRALGWRVEVEAAARGAGAGRVTVTVRERDGRPINGARVAVHFVRPTATGNDFQLQLAPVGDGRYQADFALPLEGLWDLHLDVRRGGDRFLQVRRVMLR